MSGACLESEFDCLISLIGLVAINNPIRSGDIRPQQSFYSVIPAFGVIHTTELDLSLSLSPLRVRDRARKRKAMTHVITRRTDPIDLKHPFIPWVEQKQGRRVPAPS
jgi:hypothetical protein